jgi:hypothetical protein
MNRTEPKDKNKRKNPTRERGWNKKKEKSTCGEVSDGEGGGKGYANPTNRRNQGQTTHTHETQKEDRSRAWGSWLRRNSKPN